MSCKINCIDCNRIYVTEIIQTVKLYKTVEKDFDYNRKIYKHLLYTCTVCNNPVKLCESLPARKSYEPLHMDCSVMTNKKLAKTF